MRIVIQGLGKNIRKRTLEKLELFLIVFLLFFLVGIYEFGREKEKDSTTVKEALWESLEGHVVGIFFPVLDTENTNKYHNGMETMIAKLISYPMPFCGYMNVYHEEELVDGVEETFGQEREAYIIEDVPEEMLALLNEENGFNSVTDNDFVKATKKENLVQLSLYETTEDFVKAFYTVDGVTMAVPELFDKEVLSSMDMTLRAGNQEPQILIYHTHSQEDFVDSVPGNIDTTIVGAGEMLANILEKEYGYNVIHHMGEYDVPNRDYAYSKSLPAIEQLLAENPSVEVVIDLHRDGVKETTHLVTDIGGKKTAQIMFFNGLSYTRKNGAIGYLENKNLQENLAFSFQMKMAALEYYPGLTRKNYLNAYRYNMHLRGKSLLVELGAQTNTVEEIKNAIGPLAHILDIVLGGKNT